MGFKVFLALRAGVGFAEHKFGISLEIPEVFLEENRTLSENGVLTRLRVLEGGGGLLLGF